MIEFYPKTLNSAECDHTANDREILRLILFLRRFRYYLEGSEFDRFTDNRVLKSPFNRTKLSSEGARWLETRGNFSIFPVTLKSGKIHVLGDFLSRASHFIDSRIEGSLYNSLEITFIEFEGAIYCYEDDQLFGHIVKAMDGTFPKDELQK